MATTSTINHQDIHHKPSAVGTALHHHQLAQQMPNCPSSSGDSDSAKSSSCSDAAPDDLIFFHTQSNPIMDFLLEAGDTGSSRESLANLLDEGLGTSLDGTEELCSTHPSIGRNDSGVFSSDEAVGVKHQHHPVVSSSASISISPMPIHSTQGIVNSIPNTSSSSSSSTVQVQVPQNKKSTNRQKHGSPNRQGPQRCVICGKTFSNASALTKHKLTHSDERKHSCTVCGKAFKRQDHLNGHMLTHRSKKPFQCSAENCGKSYCDARSLRRHVESRHGAEALASMTIAPTPTSDSDYSIIIPTSKTNNNSNGTKSTNPKNRRANNSVKGKSKNSKAQTNSNSSNSSNNNNPNPLLSQGSNNCNSVDSNAVEDNELLTSVENLLNLEDSSATSTENAAALLDASLIEMGVIQEEIEEEMMNKMEVDVGVDNLPSSSSSSSSVTAADDKLNNNDKSDQEDLCCITGKRMRRGEEGGGIVEIEEQSQLHQLLTNQRCLAALSKSRSGESGMNNEEDAEAAAVTLIKESLIASCANNGVINTAMGKPSFQIQLTPVPWTALSASSSPTGVVVTDSCSGMGKTIRSLESVGGILLKCPSNSTHSLKEQLELIHQIIQQTTEDSAVTFATSGGVQGVHASTLLSTAPALQLAKTQSGVTSIENINKGNENHHNNNKAVDNHGDETGPASGTGTVVVTSGSGNNSKGDESKPVECTICCRKFKNTPALNGHMRLHGGYFKKESDGKKKDSSSKDSHGAPLQTASISVRALIEEKIIQRRANNGGSSASSSNSSTPKTSPPNSTPPTPTKKPSLVNVNASFNPNNISQIQTNNVSTSSVPNKPVGGNQTLANPPPNSNPQSQLHQPLPFEDAHAEYLLIEEEVFNKVSSMCPDTFFSGIDETLLCESGIGTGSDSSQISADFFNWSETSTGANGASNALFTSMNPNPAGNNAGTNSDNPFTPLPGMDPVFFTPTPGSVHSHHSQNGEDLADSPSFIYPTPPASLESHNALQSPLFPFPFPFDASPQAGTHNLMASSTQQLVMVSPASTSTSTSSNGKTGSFTGTSTSKSSFLASPISAMSSSMNSGNAGFVPAPSNNSHLHGGIEQCASISGLSTDSSSCGDKLMSSTLDMKPFIASLHQEPSPSSSISTSTSTSSSMMLSTSTFSMGDHQVLSRPQLKGNEACPISEESFQSPNRSLGIKAECHLRLKSKALRNTLASNLRNHSSQSSAHFTPYPILSPVRSAPGLYWTFSAKLAHVDDSKKERPRINVGANFQAVIPPLEGHGTREAYAAKQCEELMWSPDVVVNSYDDDIEKYLEFACCSAIPGGGRNKEYALHVLSVCNGDINVAMLLLMNPNPVLPPHLLHYNYPETERWSREEVLQFQGSLLRHGKDFLEISKELGTKTRDACVSFYQVWKKVCPDEYRKVRSVWKKREAAFTVELLKTIPPIMQQSQQINHHPTSGTKSTSSTKESKTTKQSKTQQNNAAINRSSVGTGVGTDEFPCKICGKVFTKVKSRSAHMKSHRPPPTPPSSSPAPALSPASAATLAENKEKIADALQKHIFGKACASLAKTIQAVTASSSSSPVSPPPPRQVVTPFTPQIVKIESLTGGAGMSSIRVPVSIPTPPAQSSPSPPTSASTSTIITTTTCFEPQSSSTPTVLSAQTQPLQLHATAT